VFLKAIHVANVCDERARLAGDLLLGHVFGHSVVLGADGRVMKEAGSGMMMLIVLVLRPVLVLDEGQSIWVTTLKTPYNNIDDGVLAHEFVVAVKLVFELLDASIMSSRVAKFLRLICVSSLWTVEGRACVRFLATTLDFS